MPRRHDLRSICLIGSGPIVIGQACEFDYAGCQALKVLREDGFRTIVVNSNPATIMTDLGLRRPHVHRAARLRGGRRVLGRERPDALLVDHGRPDGAQPRAGARRGRGPRLALGIELIGAGLAAIRRAEDRERPATRCARSGCCQVPGVAHRHVSRRPGGCVAVPAVVRPAFTPAVTAAALQIDRDRAAAPGRDRVARVADRPSARRGVGTRLGRVRARGRCATPSTTSSSCAPSRTSTRWASTPATR